MEYSLSRLMAFDAEIVGTWGCLPEYYPQVLETVLAGKVSVGPFLQTRPMSSIRELSRRRTARRRTKGLF